MTINYTTLLGLAKPVTGTETGQWGDVVNNEITSLLEDAVANAATISVTSGNVTLTTTNGTSNQARMSTLIITGSPGTTRNVIAPSQAKVYQVINQSDGAVVIKGSATTGVTIAAGSTATVVWSGSDFVEIGSTVGGNLVVPGNLTVKGNTTLGDASADTVTVNGTITSNLIFTDNTYDIGASGATRPRNLYLSNNVTIGGLTSTRIPYAGTGGLLQDSAGLTWTSASFALNIGTSVGGSAQLFQNSSTGGTTAYQVAGVDKFYIGGGSSYSMFSLGEYGIATASTAPIYFGINNTKTMVLGANGLAIGNPTGTGPSYRLNLVSFSSGSTSQMNIGRGSGSHNGSGIEIISNNYTTTGTALIYMDMQNYGGSSTDVIFAKDNTATRFKVDGAGNGTFNGSVSVQSTGTGLVLSGSTQNLRLYGGTATHQYDIYGNGTSLRISDNSSGGLLNIDSSLTGVQVAGALRVGPSASSFVYDLTVSNSQNGTTGIWVANGLTNSGGSQTATIYLQSGLSGSVASLYGYLKQKWDGNTVLGNELYGDRLYMNSSGNISIGGAPLTSAPFTVRAAGVDSRILISQDGTSPYTSTLELANSAGGTYGAIFQYNVSPESLVIQNYGRSNSGTNQGAILFQTKINNSSVATAMTLNGYTGNLTFNTSNAGIIFNNSSATTNSTLNDYETGTWTPTLYTQNSSAYSFSSVTAYGLYTKIGNLVTVEFYITFSGTRGGAGGDNVGISNLPFTSKSSSVSARPVEMSMDTGATTDDTSARAGQRATIYQNQAVFLFGTTGVSNANSGYFLGNFCQFMITCTSKWVSGKATYEATF